MPHFNPGDKVTQKDEYVGTTSLTKRMIWEIITVDEDRGQISVGATVKRLFVDFDGFRKEVIGKLRLATEKDIAEVVAARMINDQVQTG